MARFSWLEVKRALLATTCVAAVGSGLAPPVKAGPSGGTVTSGQATISTPTAQSTVIQQTSNKAIINWNSFSIGSNESVQFQQPGSSAIALNRVTGGQASSLLGSLSGNGQVWLVNPNGVLVGPGAQVNVGGLIATTSDIRDGDFVAGTYSFGIASPNRNAGIVNQGTIQTAAGGSVVLSGAYVRNEGLIQASLGTVALGGAKTFTVDFAGDKLLSYAITGPVDQVPLDANGTPVTALVANSGAIKAEGGQITLTARAANHILDNVINTTGIIEANTASIVNGTVVLDAGGDGLTVAGAINATGLNSGETGGTIKALGNTVVVASSATLNASGDAGGGTILIGGNLHGAGPEPNAQNTLVAQAATIQADAVTSGNGGKVVVWADNQTFFDGSISARGGAQGGDGGFVETSGKQHLAVMTGSVDTWAALGRTGTWLLDPATININAAGSTTLPNNAGTADLFGNNPGGTDTFQASALASATSNLLLQATSDINVNTGMSFSNTGVGLTLQAGRNINFANGADLTTKGGNLSLSANDNGAGTASGSGGISVVTDVAFSTTGTLGANGTAPAGGAISFTVNGGTGGITFASDSGFNGAVMRTGGGSISLSAPFISSLTLNPITSSALNLSSSTGVNGGTINVTSTGSSGISIAGALNSRGGLGATSGAVNIQASGGGSVAIGRNLAFSTQGTGNEISSNVTSISASGAGASTSGQTPGNGGNVNITTTGGGLVFLPFGISANGGDARSTDANGNPIGLSGSTANGGNAGNIFINSSGQVFIGSALDHTATTSTGDIVGLFARGGDSTGGSGGNGGNVAVSGTTISLARIFTRGGDTLSGSGVGGNGGSIAAAGSASSGAAITLYGNSDGPTLVSGSTNGSFNARGGFSGETSFGDSSNGTLTGNGGNVFIGGSFDTTSRTGSPLNGSAYIQLATSAANPNTLVQTTGTTTNGSPSLTGLPTSFFTNVAVGETITGPGIPANTRVSSFNPSSATVTLSQNAGAGAGTGTITLTPTPNGVNNGSTVEISVSGTTGAGGALAIKGPINATTGNVESLRLLTADGTAIIAGSIGAGVPLNSLVFGSGLNNLPAGANGGAVTLNGAVTASTLIQDLRNSGFLTFNAAHSTPFFPAPGVTLKDFSSVQSLVNGNTSGSGAIVAAIQVGSTQQQSSSLATSSAFGPAPTLPVVVAVPVALPPAPVITGSTPTSSNAPQTVQDTDTGGAVFAQISPNAPPPGEAGGTGSAGSAGTTPSASTTTATESAATGATAARGLAPQGSAAGPASSTPTNARTQTPDASDRALSVVAQPPPLQPASRPMPLPPQITTPVVPGFVSSVQQPVVPKSGTPGIQQNYSSSGNSARW